MRATCFVVVEGRVLYQTPSRPSHALPYPTIPSRPPSPDSPRVDGVPSGYPVVVTGNWVGGTWFPHGIYKGGSPQGDRPRGIPKADTPGIPQGNQQENPEDSTAPNSPRGGYPQGTRGSDGELGWRSVVPPRGLQGGGARGIAQEGSSKHISQGVPRGIHRGIQRTAQHPLLPGGGGVPSGYHVVVT